MEPWLCCRTCLNVENLNPIFLLEEHKEKYSNIIHTVTGIEISPNDSLPQYMCTSCINETNKSYKFRKKCIETQKIFTNKHFDDIIKKESTFEQNFISINISELIDYDYDDINTDKLEMIYEINPLNEIETQNHVNENHTTKTTIQNQVNENHTIKTTTNSHQKTETIETQENEIIDSKIKRKRVKKEQKIKKKKEKIEEKKQREREEIECEFCHKILTSKLSLRNHYKIHTGFDVVCEHCGKKFITRRLLLMHCKAKHGYEKTDKCSFCDYRASNAEQVKIHERLHTGEKPYICSECGAGFHRNSCYLQHVAIHLPDKTVQCEVCPARFKSVTLMRIHLSRHKAPQYIYKCRVCEHTFARRRNVARHLVRIHSLQPLSEHIERSKLGKMGFDYRESGIQCLRLQGQLDTESKEQDNTALQNEKI